MEMKKCLNKAIAQIIWLWRQTVFYAWWRFFWSKRNIWASGYGKVHWLGRLIIPYGIYLLYKFDMRNFYKTN